MHIRIWEYRAEIERNTRKEFLLTFQKTMVVATLSHKGLKNLAEDNWNDLMSWSGRTRNYKIEIFRREHDTKNLT
jgi:hypothetical protein